MPFDRTLDEPPRGQRREEFETLQTTRVPRYLYRAFSPLSSGGPSHSTNSPTAIIPPAFHAHRDPPDPRQPAQTLSKLYPWYSVSEALLADMAAAHYYGRVQPLSAWSSWSASLWVAVNLARWMAGGRGRMLGKGKGEKEGEASKEGEQKQKEEKKGKEMGKEREDGFQIRTREEVYISIMDTHTLDSPLSVWHLPQILDVVVGGEHEYLAWGPIRGPGFKAVRWDDISHLIEGIIPEVRSGGTADMFSMMGLRHLFASGAPEELERGFLEKVCAVSCLFGRLAFPVAVVLINVRPRHWVRREGGGKEEDEWRGPTTEELDLVLEGLGHWSVPGGLADEAWLGEGMVDTTHFPDVRQWIYFLRALLVRKAERDAGV